MPDSRLKQDRDTLEALQLLRDVNLLSPANKLILEDLTTRMSRLVFNDIRKTLPGESRLIRAGARLAGPPP